MHDQPDDLECAESQMDNGRTAWVMLMRCHSDSDFSFVQMLLESEEIEFIVKDNYLGGDNPFMPRVSAVTGPRIMVPEDQLKRAKQVIESATPNEGADALEPESSSDPGDESTYAIGKPVRISLFVRIIALMMLLFIALILSALIWLLIPLS